MCSYIESKGSSGAKTRGEAYRVSCTAIFSFYWLYPVPALDERWKQNECYRKGAAPDARMFALSTDGG